MGATERAPVLPYFYGAQSGQFAFYRIPKALFSEPCFSGLSTDAKLLYGLMLDRLQLSIKNGWVDEHGRAYIYYKLENIQKDLGCADKKATCLLAELDAKYGLIERRRLGQGKPTVIYVKNFAGVFESERYKNRQNNESETVKTTSPDSLYLRTNNTEESKNKDSETESIYLSGKDADEMESYGFYRDFFYKQLEFGALLLDYPYENEFLYEILSLLIETACSKKKMIRICGEEKPSQVVRSQLMKLNAEHIRYVMHCMKENTSKVRNIKQYLLAALYNAPMTIHSYYGTAVRHDLYGGPE